jgi:cytoskeleton protein RodZ
MGSFGDRLKKEREQRGITLDDISLNTKIGTRLLRALEEEKFDQLPGGIFNKGFVRAYARHVGLDEEQTVADYMTAAGAVQPGPAEPEGAFPIQVAQERKAPPKAAPTPDRRIHTTGESSRRDAAADIPWGILAVVLLVIAIALAAWSYLHRPPETEKTRIAPASESAPAASPSTASDSSAQPSPSPEKTESAPQKQNPAPQTQGPPPQNTNAPQNTAPATPIPTTEQMQAHRSPVSPAGLQTSVSGQGAAPTPGMFSVRLKGNDDAEECWVSVSADGQPATEATLVAPYERVIQAKNEIAVKAGNVGALDVYFNGKKLPSQGDYGVVRTLVFHPDGLQAPAPKAPGLTQ